MSSTITLIIHGTFAKDAKWWRLGSNGEVTFADRLEDELSSRGISGSVWTPALDNNFDYSSFAWRGRNRHGDRIKGAKRLSSSLNELAQRVGATSGDPLRVNIVAHSHGGNVVLEALRRLKPNVRPGRLAMLGTPLITARPAFRLARFVSSILLLTLFFMVLVAFFIVLGLILTGNFHPKPGEPSGPYLLAMMFIALVGSGWILWLFGSLIDVAWRVLNRLDEPFFWVQGKSSSLVYGPSPKKLSATLGGEPILLLSCHNDEADLLLQIGSTPTNLYQEYVTTNFSIVGRLLEFIFVRPFVLGVHLKAVEMLLERFTLGFPIWRTLLVDYEVAPLDERPSYPASLLAQRRIDAHRIANTGMMPNEAPQPVSQLPPGLRLSLQEVIREIKLQIQLRHSSYYDNPNVVRQIGEFIAGGQVESDRKIGRPSSFKPSDSFWEVLLIANTALVALAVWLSGASSLGDILHQVFRAAIFGFACPLGVWTLILGIYWGARRRWPLRPWRYFWVVWAIFAMIFAMIFIIGARV